MTIHPALFVLLVILAAPTAVLVVYALGEYAFRRARRSRLWPACGAPFDPADDLDYHSTCIERRWHKGKHHDGSYLFGEER